MLYVNERVRVPDDEFQWSYVRAGGPGGQNVNKVASKAVLRWNVVASLNVPPDIKARFCAVHLRRITNEGDFLLTSQRYRDQERNRQDVLDKLRDMLAQASVRPKTRKATKPSRGAREARLRTKQHRAATKAARRRPSEE